MMGQIFSDPTFWVAVSFFLFIGLVYRPLGKFIGNALDSRADRISKELREAVALREEAQSLLAEYQRKQRENMDEAKRIVEQTKADAQAMAERAEQELRDTLQKRKLMAIDKIQQAEISAIRMVQQNVADIALKASHTMVEESANKDKLLDEALNDIETQLKNKAA